MTSPFACLTKKRLTPLFQGGDIFIWDTESGVLLHHILGQAHSGDLTCIAWNHAVSEPFMFASGSHDGTVRIWTKSPITPDSSPRDPGLDFDFKRHPSHSTDYGYFSYGEMMDPSTSPKPDLGLTLHPPDDPDDELHRERPVKSPRGLSMVSSQSSESSIMKMR